MTRWRMSVILAVLALLVGACSSDETEDGASGTSAFVPKPALTLVVNDWTASGIDVAIAEQLIERYLGYPVLPERVDDSTEMYEGLADGSLDAVLEVWPSAMSERDRRFFESGQVENLGELGSVGKIGWWVPRYVIDDDPSLATWEGFADPAVASRFATSATSPHGRLLGTNPDYQQFDEQIVANLGLPLTVEFSGSEAATRAELERAVAAREPILVYWWTPTAPVAAFDLVNVALPAPTDECRLSAATGDGGVACDYPTETLFKAGSPDLAVKAPDAHAFLQAFSISTDDQLALLQDVEFDGLTIDQAARGWIDGNEAIWRTWLEQGDDDDG